MNPEIGWSELLVIGLIAIIVVGPKDLPLLMRKFGQFMTRARNAAAEFQASLDELGRQAELDSLRKEAMKAQRAISDAAFSVSSAIEDPARTKYGADLLMPPEPAVADPSAGTDAPFDAAVEVSDAPANGVEDDGTTDSATKAGASHGVDQDAPPAMCDVHAADLADGPDLVSPVKEIRS